MADRYWVGGTGSWTDATKWSNVSGGTGGFSVPSYLDNAYINGDSDINAPFKISISGTNAEVVKLTVENLSYSLSLVVVPFKDVFLSSLNILDPKVYFNGRGGSSLYLSKDYQLVFDPKGTATYNSVVPLHNFYIYFESVKLKSDLSISNSISLNYWELISSEYFYADNKTIRIKNGTSGYVELGNTGGPTNSLTYAFVFKNSKFSADELGNDIYLAFDSYLSSRNYNNILPDFTNTTFSISGAGCGIFCYIEQNKETILPSINFINTIFSNSSRIVGIYSANRSKPYSTAIGYIPKLSYTKRHNVGVFSYLRLIAEKWYQNINDIYYKIGELAISASAFNRVILTGSQNITNTNPNAATSVFIESASLSQVIFNRINVIGFRELSVSFSASNIGWFDTFPPHNRNIKFPAQKTVYWNNTVGGDFYSNSFTSATGGTVTTTWIPFPQDIVKITDAGLDTSATISLNSGGAYNIFPSITSLERSLPMSWYISLSLNSLYFSGFLKTNANHTFKGNSFGFFDNYFLSGTLDVKSKINFDLNFAGPKPKFIKSKIDSTKSITTLQANLDFGENSISCYRITIDRFSSLINKPSVIKFSESGIIETHFTDTNFYFNTTFANSNLVRGTFWDSSDYHVKIGSLYLQGGSFSYSISLVGLSIGNLIYNKIGNITIGVNPTRPPITVKRLKLMGQPNGSATASIRFTSTSTSLTAVITYAGVDTAASLSFVEFTRVVLGPKRDAAETYRVFAGTRSTTTPANNGPWYTNKPKITNVNAGNDVLSNSKINIITDVTSGFFPVFSVKYKDVTITDLSLNNSTTYVATFPNYFANNIKVGAKHELKIIRGR